ncbi:MAG: hypothetical protein N2050_00935 [Flavobacteriales bacterium]|nr:hypothetical protein [Flavobacteriales bacterium]
MESNHYENSSFGEELSIYKQGSVKANSPESEKMADPTEVFPMKLVLGLDIGTNSIGAALIKIPESFEYYTKKGEILWLGTRIIPTDGEYLTKFEAGGQVETKTAARRMKRMSRRLKFRYKLRRARLTKVFKILGWVPDHFPLDDPKKIKELTKENQGIFKFNFNDYLPLSDETLNEVKNILGKNENGKIPIDWSIYYLRKKALTKKITIPELVRIIYLFNQRRGFKSSRKDLREEKDYLSYEEFLHSMASNSDKKIDNELTTKFISKTKITDVRQISDTPNKKGRYKFEITVEDKRVHPWVIEKISKPAWEGGEYSFIVEQKFIKGEIIQNKAPIFVSSEEKDTTLLMLALDESIQMSGKHVGEYFWDIIEKSSKEHKYFKIRQNIVKRRRYENELKAIWEKQVALRVAEGRAEELINSDKIQLIAETLYRNNYEKQNEIKEKGLYHLIANDIIYYQRELKSQKSKIAECRFEKRIGKQKDEYGNWITTGKYGLKCCPISSPIFQEFRIWCDIHNLRIIRKETDVDGVLKLDLDETSLYLDEFIKENLFELFDSKNEITQNDIFERINKLKNCHLSNKTHKINLFASRDKLKGNQTKSAFRKIFKMCNIEELSDSLLNNPTALFDLWQIVYSAESSDLEKTFKAIETALKKRFKEIPEKAIEEIKKLTFQEKGYASYSALAIKKLLSVMRCGRYWSWENLQMIKIKTPSLNSEGENAVFLSDYIDNLIREGWEKSFKINKSTGELKIIKEFKTRTDFSGLPRWLASYLIYGRDSERESSIKYQSLDEIKSLNISQLPELKKLRANPLVRQVVKETLQLVREVSLAYGQPDEIHIELAREIKKNAREKQKIAELQAKNLEEKKQAQIILRELASGPFEHYIDDNKTIVSDFPQNRKPNYKSNSDIEKFRIYKSCASFSSHSKEKEKDENWIEELFKNGKTPSRNDVLRYILWLSQKCRSPYTGKIIPLSKLFDDNFYEKEHIIPRSKFKDDSMDNIIIAETGINKAKDRKLAAQFIREANGTCNYGGVEYKLLKYNEYVEHCKKNFKGRKLKNLLATEVPDTFIERQINDTRYIGRKLGELLYPFAKKQEGLVFTIGSITNELKVCWGLEKVWKRILEPRFRRLENLMGKKYIEERDSDIIFSVPETENLTLKRLDHRNHALDALVVAATTREHIRFLSTLNAADTDEERKKIQYRLCKNKIRDFHLPWPGFTKEAKEKLNEIIVTFKETTPVVSKPRNRYMKWVKSSEGRLEKKYVKQKSNKNWRAVRRSLFKENPLGIVYIKEIKDMDVMSALKVQLKRRIGENDKENRKILSYIYEKEVRQIVNEIIEKISDANGISLTPENETVLFDRFTDFMKRKREGKRYLIGSKTYEKIKVAEFHRYKIKRVPLDSSFKNDKKLNKIPYAQKSPLKEVLSKHIESFKNANEAFSGEGLEFLASTNKKPIRKVRLLDGRLDDSQVENLEGMKKYWEADAGSIAFLIIYENMLTKERTEQTSVSTFSILKRLREGKSIIEKRPGYKTIVLRPNDLVYVPTDEEFEKIKNNDPHPIDWSNKKHIASRVYKMVSADNAFFIQHHIAKPIIPSKITGDNKTKGEIDWHNKSLKTFDGKIISERCIKLKIDRLGSYVPPLC